eukprot:5943576-Prymnesium_polylepis.1
MSPLDPFRDPAHVHSPQRETAALNARTAAETASAAGGEALGPRRTEAATVASWCQPRSWASSNLTFWWGVVARRRRRRRRSPPLQNDSNMTDARGRL